jgi:glutathione S-transferase
LKGRPPGTKKSTDPEKKKRKRVARERDLCDVKVKITEYFDQNEYEEQLGQKPPGAAEDNPSSPIVAPNHGQTQQYLAQTWGAPPTPSKKFYTFQRVNGNGGNGKGDGIAGPHKHSLADSDRVKKNSVIRWLAKCEKEDRKNLQVRSFPFVAPFSLVSQILFFVSIVQRWACTASH